jgi:hypothetical protein
MYFSIVLKGLVEHNLPYDGPKSRTWTETLKKIEIKNLVRKRQGFFREAHTEHGADSEGFGLGWMPHIPEPAINPDRDEETGKGWFKVL